MGSECLVKGSCSKCGTEYEYLVRYTDLQQTWGLCGICNSVFSCDRYLLAEFLKSDFGRFPVSEVERSIIDARRKRALGQGAWQKKTEVGLFEEIKSLVGKEIQEVAVTEDEMIIDFRDDQQTTLKVVDAGQYCCERRWLSCDDQLDEFVGHKLVGMEVLDCQMAVDEDERCNEVLFLRVITDAGSFRVCAHNSHNGYYGGFDLTCSVTNG